MDGSTIRIRNLVCGARALMAGVLALALAFPVHAVDQLNLFELDRNFADDYAEFDSCGGGAPSACSINWTDNVGGQYFNVINGLLDLNQDGSITTADTGNVNANGSVYKVKNGFIDRDGDDKVGLTEGGAEDTCYSAGIAPPGHVAGGCFDGLDVLFGYLDYNQDGAAPSKDGGADAESLYNDVDGSSGSFQFFFGRDDTMTNLNGAPICDTGIPDNVNQSDCTIYTGGGSKDPEVITSYVNRNVQAGRVDINNDTFYDTKDDRSPFGLYVMKDGYVDVDGDGTVPEEGDDGEYLGYPVIDGRIVVGASCATVDTAGLANGAGCNGVIPLWVGGWEWTEGNLQNKNDINTAFASTFLYENPAAAGDVHQDGDFILYYGLDIIPATGSAVGSFWLLQDETIGLTLAQGQTNNTRQWVGRHTDGDLLIQVNQAKDEALAFVWNPLAGDGVFGNEVYELDINGDGVFNSADVNDSSTPNISPVFAGTTCQANSADEPICAVANSERQRPVPESPNQWPYVHTFSNIEDFYEIYNAGNIIEGGINVSAVYRRLNISPPCFAKAVVSTRTTDSVSGTLTDFLLTGFESCAISIEKFGDEIAVVGDTVYYTIRITNDGLLPLNLTDLSDDLVDAQSGAGTTLEAAWAAGCTYLTPRQSCTFQLAYKTQPGDPDPLINNVTGSYESLDGNDSFPISDTHTVDLIHTGSIGDRVWLDEDGNGLQDAGEDGISGVTVILRAAETIVIDGVTYSSGDIIATTVTDIDGGYRFTGLPEADYTVELDGAGDPALDGLVQTYDPDGTLDLSNAVTLAGGESTDLVDFGLNYVFSASTDTPLAGATGAIGDRIWNDADGDGVQDEGESGIAGVFVALAYDSDNDGVVDAVYATTVTDGSGDYSFDDLPPGVYEVVLLGGITDPALLPAPGDPVPTASGPAGYTATYDPDTGANCTTSVCDDTTAPILLAPGDVYVNADFGYQNTALYDVSGSIYLDAQADFDLNAGDVTLEGVTVSLAQSWAIFNGYLDYDGDGVTDGDTGDTGYVDGVYVINGKLDLDGDGFITEADDGWFNGVRVVDGLLDVNGDAVDDPGVLAVADPADDGTVNVIVASTTTGANGAYTFYDQPNGDYVVLVTDTNGVLLDTTEAEQAGTFTINGATVSGVDFGYLPIGHDAGEGLIGGSVGLDWINPASDEVDAGEGLADIGVNLYRFFNVSGGRIDYNGDGTVSNNGSDDGPIMVDVDGDGDFDVYCIYQGYVDVDCDGDIDVDDDLSLAQTSGTFLAGYTVVDGVIQLSGSPATGTLAYLADTTTTNASGDYVFGNLDPEGLYKVEIDSATLPPGTAPNFDWDTECTAPPDTCIPGSLDGASLVNLFESANGSQTGVDFGVVGPNSLSGTIWNDSNADGSNGFDGTGAADGSTDETALGLEGVTVELRAVYNVYNGLIDTNGDGATGGSGDDGSLGDYAVIDGYLDIDGDGQITDADDGTVQGYRVVDGFIDVDGDATDNLGSIDPPGDADDDASLLGAVVATTTTDEFGDYSFTNLPNGTFQVKVTDEDNLLNGYWLSDGVNDGDDNNSQTDPYTVTLNGGQSNDTADFGYYIDSPSVGDFIFYDANGNGVFDAGDSGLAGVTVTLTITYDTGDTVVLSTVSSDGNSDVDGDGVVDPLGYYSFGNLLLDEDLDGYGSGEPTYVVTAATPTGMISTYDGTPDADGVGAGTNDNSDNEAGENAWPAQDYSDGTNDFGFVTPARVSGNVIDDANGDGIYDAGETGIGGVTVELWADTDNDGLPDELIATTTTVSLADQPVDLDGDGFDDPVGFYYFEGITPDDYVIIERDPDGYASTNDATGAAFDNLIDVALADDQYLTDQNFLDTLSDNVSAPIYGRVVDDADGDGDLTERFSEAGIGGVIIELWADSDGDGTPDVYMESFTTISTPTDLDGDGILEPVGSYYFGDIGPGTYVIVESSDPAGYTSTNDIYGPNDNWVPVVRYADTPSFGNDFLDSQTPDLGSIGDTVFLDRNGNGLADPGEGIAGVTVWADYDGDGVVDANEPSAVTDANGYYLLEDMPVGSFSIKVLTSTLPGGVTASVDLDGNADNQTTVTLGSSEDFDGADFGYTGSASIGDTIYLDADNDGVYDAGEGIAGAVVFIDSNGNGILDPGEPRATTDANGQYLIDGLAAGTYTVVVDENSLPSNYLNTVDPDGTADSQSTFTLNANDTVVNADWGYREAGSISGTIYDDNSSPLNGDYDLGEDDPLEGITVRLCADAACNVVVATTTTDANGYYEFPKVLPGAYELEVDTSGLLAGVPNYEEPDDGLGDSSDIAVGGGDSKSLVSVGTGALTGQDFGYDQPEDDALLAVDKSAVPASGSTVHPGDVLVYTILPDSTAFLAQQYEDARIIDATPPGTTFMSASPATLSQPAAGGTGPVIWDLGSNTPAVDGDNTDFTYRDDFTVAAYGNNDGVEAFSADWVEADYGVAASPTTGRIQVVGGTGSAGYLQFTSAQAAAASQNAAHSIYREADLSGATGITLSYDLLLNEFDPDNSERVVIEVSVDGGSTYTTVATISGKTATPAGSYSHDVLAALTGAGKTPSASTRLRLRQAAGDSDGKRLRLDFVQLQVTAAPAAQTTMSIVATPPLATNNEPMTIQIIISTDTTLSGVKPEYPTVVDAVGGAVCDGFNPPSTFLPTRTIDAGESYTWVVFCNANTESATVPSRLAFHSAGASGTYGGGTPADIKPATSNSVLMPPPLTFSVQVNDPATVTDVVNTAVFQDSLVETEGVLSNTVTHPVDVDVDYGDLPDSYGTTEASDGARHLMYGVYLGTAPDAEADGPAAGDGTQDDTTGTADEDGVVFGPIVQGETATVTVTASGSGVLNAWADWNGNGTFDEGEQILSDEPLAAGSNTLSYDVPTTALVQDVEIRFRVTDTTGQGGDSPTGLAITGEVEDYTAPVVSFGSGTGTISGSVANDSDGDGNPLDADAPIEGVTVSLYWDDDGNGIYDGTEPLVAVDVTDVNGDYSFTNLPALDYLVVESNPATAISTYDSDGTGNGLDAIAVELADGQTSTGNDFLDTYPVSWAIGDLVWLDTDGDGIQDNGEAGLANVEVRLYEDRDGDGDIDAADLTVQIVDGVLNLNGDGVIGAGDSGVWYDIDVIDGQLDTDGDGFITAADDGEVVVDGVTYAIIDGLLYTAVGGTLVSGTIDGAYDAQLTGANGGYLFTGDQAGVYEVYVIDSTLPPELKTAPATTDPSGPIIITSSVELFDVDFGYVGLDSSKVIIGDRVWSDANQDGIQDPGEPGIEGVLVNLLYADGTPVLDGANQPITTTTGPAGQYVFTDIPPGEYRVEIDPSNFDPGGPLEGYTVTSGPQSEGDELSTTRSLYPGDITVDLDFGYYSPSTYSISDRIWFDLSGDGNYNPLGLDGNGATTGDNEYGLGGVVVHLLDENGKVVATTTTNPDGTFTFDGVPDGDYTIAIADLTNELDGLTGTRPPATAYALDVTVSGGDIDNTTAPNFGYNIPGAIGDRIWNDWDGDGIQDDGEVGLPGVIVQLWADADGNGVFDPNVDTLLDEQTTDGGGNYLFSGLASGTYFTVVKDTNFQTGGALDSAVFTATSDPDGTLDNVTKVNLASSSATILWADFGYQADLSDVSGSVWNDLNENGVLENGEPDLAGVTVDLIYCGTGTCDDGDEAVAGTAITDANGNYTFVGVPDGNYQVVVTDTERVLKGYDLTSSTDEVAVTVAGADTSGIDFGYARRETIGSIGDKIFFDSNGDGLQSPTEPGIAGVTVNLYDIGPDGIAGNGDDVLIGTATTDSKGNYLFDGLAAGTYYVDVDETTLPDSTADGEQDLALSYGTPGSAGLIYLSEGETDLSADFGYKSATKGAPGSEYDTITLGDRVWNDVDGDGIQDPGEIGIPGVDILIYDSDTGALIATATTADDGSWYVTGLPAGKSYTLTVDDATLPAGYSDTPTNMDGGDVYVTSASVSGGTALLHLDWGFTGGASGSIGDYVWIETDNDGIKEPGEPGLANVRVNLYSAGADGIVGTADDFFLASTLTDSDGAYKFTGLDENSVYYVTIGRPRYGLDPLNANAVNRQTAGVTVPNGDFYQAADFTYSPEPGTAVIGNSVWSDADGDGVQDEGETGIVGVTVYLYDPGPDGEIGGTDDVLVRTTTTGADGSYWFADIPPGDYYVTTVPPSGYTLTGDPDETGACVTCDNATLFTVTADQIYTDADFGYQDLANAQGVIGDTVYEDTDGNGTQDVGESGIENVTVSLYYPGPDGVFGTSDDALVASTTTDASGNYSFSGLTAGNYQVRITDTGDVLKGLVQTESEEGTITLATNQTFSDADFGYTSPVPPGSIAGTVYFDGDGDANYAGDDFGVSNVTVNLLDGAGNVVASTTTDANGNYSFEGVAAGTYTVVVTDQNDVLGSLLPTETTGPITVNCGATSCDDVTGANFGYEPTQDYYSNLGGTVWWDTDQTLATGTLQPEESGLEGVTVELWLDVNGNGIIEPGTDNLVRTTTTDSNGNYYFLALPPGDYIVRVPDDETADVWGNSTDGNGVSGNGVLDGMTRVTGPSPTLDSNGHLNEYAVTLGSSETNTSVDFAYEAEVPLTISGTVFEDADGQGGAFESGTDVPGEGTTIYLYREVNGELFLMATTVADENGDYSFTDVPSGGTYVVRTDVAGTPLEGLDQTVDPDGVLDSQTRYEDLTTSQSGQDYAYWNGGTVTTPVTLSYFEAQPGEVDGQVKFRWATSTETGNAGFDIYEIGPTGLYRVNDTVIPAQRGLTLGDREYELTVDGVAGERFFIVDIDVFGQEVFHGPFELGRVHGVKNAPVNPIDWKSIRDEHQSKKAAQEERKREKMQDKLERQKQKLKDKGRWSDDDSG